MVTTKHIKSFLGLSLILILFCIHLTSARAALIQLKNDNDTAEGYHSQWQAGNIIGAVLTPNPAWSYPVKVNSVEFMLYRFAGAATSATVRVHVYSVVGGVPSTLLGSSAPTTINTFYPNWASIHLTSANITLASSTSFMVAIEYTAGASGSTPSTLADNQNNIVTGKNFYSLNGGATWIEHYNFWAEPGNVGYNMIRATVNNTPPPTSTPTPTPTHTPAPPPTVVWKSILPIILKNWSPPTPSPGPIPFVGTTNQGRSVDLDIKPDLSAVTRFRLNARVECPGVTSEGAPQISNPTGWPITNRKFEIRTSAGGGKEDVFTGEFDPTFSSVQGTWLRWIVIFDQPKCNNTGTWNASRQ